MRFGAITFLILCALVGLLSPATYAQTLRYNPPASASCGTGPLCTVSLSGTPVIAGDTIAYQCAANAGNVIISTANGGALKLLPATSPGGGGFTVSQAYILSAAAESGSETVTFGFPNGTQNFTSGSCTIWELA